MAATEIENFIEVNKHLITPEMAQKIINKRCEIVKEMFYIYDNEIEKLYQEIEENVDECLDYFIYDLLKEEIDGMRNFNYVEDDRRTDGLLKKYVEDYIDDESLDYKDYGPICDCIAQLYECIDMTKLMYPKDKKAITKLKRQIKVLEAKLNMLDIYYGRG